MNLIKCLFLSILSMLSLTGYLSAQEGDNKKIGCILPLSGPLAEYGIAAKNGIEMARSDAPKAFKGIKFVFEDSKYQAKEAVSAFNKLRRDKNLALIYVWGNPTSEAIAPLAEKFKVPTLAMVLNPKVSTDREYVIRSTNYDALFSKRLVEAMSARQIKKLAVVVSENSYLNGILDGIKRFADDNLKIDIVQRYQPSDMDFRSSITRIKGKNYDAIAVFLMSGQVGQFYKQMKQQKLNLPSYGTDFFESKTEIQQSGGAMEGAYYTHLGVSEDFRKQYVARFGNDLQLAYAGNGYDIANIAANAIKAKKAKLITSLKDVKSYRGVSGIANFKNTADGGAFYEFPVRLKQISGESFKEIR